MSAGPRPWPRVEKGCAKMSDTVWFGISASVRRVHARLGTATDGRRLECTHPLPLLYTGTQRPRNASRLMPVQRAVVGNGRVRAV